MKTCPVCDTLYPDQRSTCPNDGAVLFESRQRAAGEIVRSKYRIVRKLGETVTGAVYLAEHLMLASQMTLKFLAAELCRNSRFVERFRDEVRAAYQLRHPNIVAVTDLDQDENGSLFIAMEYVAGPSLRQVLRETKGSFPIPSAIQIARGVAAGLAAAHARGVVHRDIKPENILLLFEPEGEIRPKVFDFGIDAVAESITAFSRTRGFLLASEYAAPKQCHRMLSSQVDGRADIYSLGGILYEMLVGRTAFQAERPEGWMYQHLQPKPKSPSSHRPEVLDYPGLDALVIRLLACEGEERFQSAESVFEALGHFIAAPAVHAPRPSSLPTTHARSESVQDIWDDSGGVDHRGSTSLLVQQRPAEPQALIARKEAAADNIVHVRSPSKRSSRHTKESSLTARPEWLRALVMTSVILACILVCIIGVPIAFRFAFRRPVAPPRGDGSVRPGLASEQNPTANPPQRAREFSAVLRAPTSQQSGQIGDQKQGATVSGTVTNKTTGKPSAGDLVVLIDVQRRMADVASSTTNSRGRYSLQLPHVGPFLIRVNHQGATYFIAAPSGNAPGDVAVYEVAPKVEGVVIDADMLLMEAASSSLRVRERYLIRNSRLPPKAQYSDKMFEIALPADAVLDGASATRPAGIGTNTRLVPLGTRNRYTFNVPILPDQGEKETIFEVQYHMPYMGKYTFLHGEPMHADNLVIYLPKGMFFVPKSGGDFQQFEEDPRVRAFIHENVEPGQFMGFTVSGTGQMPRSP